MAPIGPSGGGPVGSSNSFVGAQQALELVGNHAYAYNFQTVNAATVTFFEFTTGNYYFVGTLGGGRNMKSGAETECTIEFNDGQVFFSKWDNGAGQTLVMPMAAPLPLIIPAYTKVKIILENDTTDNIALIIAGRIYR